MRGAEEIEIELSANISVSSTSGAVAAALGGLGVTTTTLWSCERELSENKLVRLLPDWETPAFPVHAYFPMGRSTRASARAFIDWLMPELRA